MELRDAIEYLRADIQRFADSGKARPDLIAFKQVVLNTVIDKINQQEAHQLELDAQVHQSLARALYAEGTADILTEWCIMHGVDPRHCFGLADDQSGRPLQVFQRARAEMIRGMQQNGTAGELFTPGVERSRAAYFLLLKHSAPRQAFLKHQDTMIGNATAAVKEPAAA